MIILNEYQGSDQWLKARRSIPTASCFGKIITSAGKKSAQSEGYINQLLAEYLDPKYLMMDFYSKDMEWGKEQEEPARLLYQEITGLKVSEVGGVFLNESKEAMCSPDGLIYNKQKGLEIKCPRLNNHIANVRNGCMPSKYSIQVQAAMLFTGYNSWDFMSYHPSFRCLIVNVKRNNELIDKIKDALEEFNKKLNFEKRIIDDYKKQLGEF